MGNDDRHGADRWQGGGRERGYQGDGERDYREEGRGGGWNEGRRESMGWGPGGGDRHDSHGQGGGFFERASEAARSWFGSGDHDEGRGGAGQRGSYRDNGYGERGGSGTLGGGGFGGGWGNQEADSWHRDRPGRPGWFTDSVGGERGRRPGAGDESAYGSRGRPQEQGRGGGEPWGGGRQEPPRGFGGGGISGEPSAPPYAPMTGDYGRGSHHDPHYSEWRRRQMEALDRDYAEYRREHQAKFESEFGSWRTRRQGQREMVGKAAEHMEVLGSDGSHVGTVDKVSGDRIVLTRNDPNAGGIHHSVPCSWVETVDDKVRLNRTADQAIAEWRDEDRNRALFERPDAGSEGPHVLNRSFAGTYRDEDPPRDR